jgi:putative transposase
LQSFERHPERAGIPHKVWYAVAMRIRRLNHSVYQIKYHIVWGTRYRRKILKPYVRTELVKCFIKLQRSHPDWYFEKFNTGSDHVHLMVEVPPKFAVADVVRELKKESCKWIREKFSYIRRIYEKKEGIWSVGYFVSTVGLNEEQIRQYIEKQNNWERSEDVSAEFS